MHISRRRAIIYTVITVVAFAAAAEVGVRLVCWAIGRVPYTVATPWMQADDELLYVFQPHFEGRVYQTTARINNHGLRGEDCTTSKPKNTLRVLCLGDSRTFGFFTGQDECYPAQLERLWRERVPNHRLEVLNAGMPGYSSYQGLRYLELRGLRFEPDVVTVAFGANERRFVLRPEQADGAQWFRQAARGLRQRQRLRFSYALLGAAKVLRRARGVDRWNRDVLASPSQRLDDLPCRVDRETFRQNLRRIARLCRERGIRLILITMADAPAIEQAFDEGRRLRSQERYDEAIEAFSRIGREPADRPTEQWCRALVLYEIGLTRQAEGRTSEALAAFRESAQTAAFWSALGGRLIRHARDYVEIMREVASEVETPCLDIAARFAQRPELFADYCHFTARGHRAIAEGLADCLAKGQPATSNQQLTTDNWRSRVLDLQTAATLVAFEGQLDQPIKQLREAHAARLPQLGIHTDAREAGN